MLDLHIRNDTFINSTGKEEHEAYGLRNRFLIYDILLGKKDQEVSSEELTEHLVINWGVKLFSAPSANEFLTSDNPSFLISCSASKPALHMVVLPITPKIVAIAYDRRYLTLISDAINGDDEKNINDGQILNATSCIYTSSMLTEAKLNH